MRERGLPTLQQMTFRERVVEPCHVFMGLEKPH